MHIPTARRKPRTPTRTPERLEQRLLFAADDLDPSFGLGGIARVDYGLGVTVHDVAATGSRVYVAVGVGPQDASTIGLYAFDAAGRPDTAFAGGSLNTGEFGSRAGVLPVGSKVLVSTRNTLVRYNADGSADRSFGVTPFNNGHVFVGTGGSIAAAPGGKIVVAGSAGAGGQFGVARVNANGTLDKTFGRTGIIATDFGGRNDWGISGAVDVAVQPDGKILVVGTTPDGDGSAGRDAAVARFNVDGTYDATFDGDGRLTIDSGGLGDAATAVAVLPDGGILIGFTDNQLSAYPIRLNPDGSRDSQYLGARFNPDGNAVPFVRDLEVAGGNVLALIDRSVPGSGTPALARYTQDGSLDVNFGGGRFVPTDGDVLTVAPSGRAVVAGGNPFLDEVIVARYQTARDPLLTVLQAEDAVRQGAVERHDQPGYVGRGYVDFLAPAGELLEWHVTAFQTGQHWLKIRYANGSRTSRPMRLRVGAHEEIVQFPPTGSWKTWDAATFYLPLNANGASAAPNLVSLESVGSSGPNVDSLIVSRPIPYAAAEGVFQAERGVLWGARVDGRERGFTGRGYVDYANPLGDYVAWNVNAAPASTTTTAEGPVGRYTLTIRYANGGLTDRPLRLLINDQVWRELSFEPTGSWSTWRTLTVPLLSLKAGINLVQLTSTRNNGPNLDWMAFTEDRR